MDSLRIKRDNTTCKDLLYIQDLHLVSGGCLIPLSYKAHESWQIIEVGVVTVQSRVENKFSTQPCVRYLASGWRSLCYQFLHSRRCEGKSFIQAKTRNRVQGSHFIYRGVRDDCTESRAVVHGEHCDCSLWEL